jgi:hypothetical protein
MLIFFLSFFFYMTGELGQGLAGGRGEVVGKGIGG